VVPFASFKHSSAAGPVWTPLNPADRQAEQVAKFGSATALAEASDQVPDAERDGSGRVGALLDRGAQEIASLAASFADGFRCLGRGLLRLAVHLLQRTFHLPCLTLDLRFHITGRSSESFFHLSANAFGSPAEAIFIHGHSTS